MQHPTHGTSEISNPKKPNRYPFFAPRIWHGWGTKEWLELLKENNFQVDRWFNFTSISFTTLGNTVGSCLQSMLYDRKAEQTPLASPPTFLLGHWRTGTTHLHNLMALDKRHWAPTCLQCFAPRHFKVTWPIATSLHLPRQRPQDDVEFGWDQPQECEYALAAMGLPSVYRNYAFPRNTSAHLESINMDGLSANQVNAWKTGYMKFIRLLNHIEKRPLVLKSPTNTGRIRILLEMFPDAKFVHIDRSPHDFIPSTIRMHELLSDLHGLQNKLQRFDAVKFTFDCFQRVYGGFERDRSLIPAANYHEIRFEDLVAKPIETIESTYAQLGIDDFESVRPLVAAAIEKKKGYVRNQHHISTKLSRRIDEVCHQYIRMFGYDGEPTRRVA